MDWDWDERKGIFGMNIEAYNVDSLRKLVRDSGHGGRIVTDDPLRLFMIY